MLAGEASAQPGAYSWLVGYGYGYNANANGHLSTLTYPSLMSVLACRRSRWPQNAASTTSAGPVAATR